MTIMGTDYARLILKTQSILRSVVANLPIDIQLRILESKAMFRSFDLWLKNLAELPYVRYVLRSKVPMSATTSRLLQYSKYDPMLMLKILLLTRVILESFKKEKGRFFMPTFCHIFYALVMILYTLPCFF